jgi:hypothetical protein
VNIDKVSAFASHFRLHISNFALVYCCYVGVLELNMGHITKREAFAGIQWHLYRGAPDKDSLPEGQWGINPVNLLFRILKSETN